jgi:hypothetical protein
MCEKFCEENYRSAKWYQDQDSCIFFFSYDVLCNTFQIQSSFFNIGHWMEVSSEIDTPAALILEKNVGKGTIAA